jgi:hypothetical protein
MASCAVIVYNVVSKFISITEICQKMVNKLNAEIHIIKLCVVFGNSVLCEVWFIIQLSQMLCF